MVVIDYSRDGTDAGTYSPSEISKIKSAGIIPIAYISIGEAEDYRFYWNNSWYVDPPEWLGRENPNWPGCYAVKYWYDEWKQIIFSYIDKADEFEYWSDPENGENFTRHNQWVGMEDLFYNGTEKLPEHITSERIYYLDEAKKRGKVVLVVDYVDDGLGYVGDNLNRIEDFISLARQHSYIPYVARSEGRPMNL